MVSFVPHGPFLTSAASPVVDAGWLVERFVGPASEFHARAVPEPCGRAVWVHEVDRPALVLGSAQHDGVADRDALGVHGVELVRRRSGGGAVLLVPGAVLWVDVLLPAGDALWDDDIGRSTHWLGSVWAAVLGREARVHTGPMVHRTWSKVVCFAGLGPGEVTVGGRKAVGISQRRTRGGARFQCALYRAFDADLLCALLAAPRPSAHELVDDVHLVDEPMAAVLDRFVRSLPTT